jgi:phage virion morphogenesis protein
MPVSFRIDDAEINATLARAIDAGGDTRALMDAIGETMQEDTRQTFAAQGRPEKWRAWSDATVRSYQAGLSRTKKGALTAKSQRKFAKRRILMSPALRLFNSIIHKAYDAAVEWGSNLVYAAIHNFGGTAGRGSVLPKRQYIMPPFDDAREDILALMENHVKAAMAGAS